ncbi:MAG: sulfopyruvate decarboxylase subunit beta, partial [Candidatus Freyarchaeota archaeon]|nr:sulfopyruvate decarboxylase subunit beta [Candidatus Jordarchaeia archaeon]
ADYSLMNLGSLVTIANQSPPNLTLIVLDNESYSSTGGQLSYTAGKTSLAEIARATGIENVLEVRSVEELKRALSESKGKTSVIVAKVEKGNVNVPVIPLSPYRIKKRFMKAAKNS